MENFTTRELRTIVWMCQCQQAKVALEDIEKGRKCEIDYVNGVVCKEGAKVGVETPICQQIVEIVHGIENGLYETTYKNVEFF